MKIVKYLIAFLVLLLIGFFLMGIIKKKISYETEIVVNKPIAESWAVSQDEGKLGEWLSGFQKYEHISGVPGTAGAVSKVHFDDGGEKMIITETIKEVIPNKSIAMSFSSEFMDMEYQMAMTPFEGKTKIISTTEAVGNSAISKSIMALMSGSIQDQEDMNMANLKKVIEQNTKNYLINDSTAIEQVNK